MQRTLVVLGCALTFIAGSALAQQQNAGGSSGGANDSGGASLTDKARQAAQTIGEKTKEAAGKVRDMAQEAAQKAKAGGDQNTGQRGQSPQSERMQKQADADFKSAKAKCDSVQAQAQRTVCEKRAAVTHANAELRIAKADAAAEGGKTSSMGAGKAAR